ncbi:MAG: MFS transporter [Candidatus Aenigmarchaeota archaeon]|nr:MFS transporter [Candidatus Aenigmarchaeota archaeon]
MKYYHKVWALLFFAWMFSYIDRSVTGPVVSWMIKNKVEFFASAGIPHALGGLIGAMFFAGYMLTQFPAGYLGDRYGRKALIVISTVWAGIATFISGIAGSLSVFIASRVLTGLGEGAYYSNDRALIAEVTPKKERALGMGIVFVGLAAGLTFATVLAPAIIEWAAAIGPFFSWRSPFLVFSIPTVLTGLLIFSLVKGDKRDNYKAALKYLAKYSAVFFIIIMAIYVGTVYLNETFSWDKFHLQLIQSASLTAVAIALIGIIYKRLGNSLRPILADRNLIVMYISAVPILYTLWFFGFWMVLLFSDASKIGLTSAALYAGIFGVANAIGYPLGGKLSDFAVSRGLGRRKIYMALALMASLMTFFLGYYILNNGSDLVILAVISFFIGLPFSAMQTVHMALTADLSPEKLRAQAFGMWNLVAEIGAILSPLITGILRDITGSWAAAVYSSAILLAISAALLFFVREKPGEP